MSGASYNNSYVYMHLGQLWQGPLGGSGTQQQYLYRTSQPHELTGLFASGATCTSQTGQVYASSYEAGVTSPAARTAAPPRRSPMICSITL